jgi:hypothetical protein
MSRAVFAGVAMQRNPFKASERPIAMKVTRLLPSTKGRFGLMLATRAGLNTLKSDPPI